MIDILTAFGTLATLLAWLRSEIGDRLTKNEILRRLSQQDTVQSYCEWLRRKDQTQIINEIEGGKSELLSHLVDVAPQLSALAVQVRSFAGDLVARLDDFDARIHPPVLYPVPLETRASVAIALRGRAKEIDFLKSQSSDVLLIGQPGAGKTYLLQEFARIIPAQFLLTNEADMAISAITVACPPLVIVDDAWQRQEIIQRLRHARSTHKLPFRIIAVCWPFEKSEMQQALQIAPDKMLELERLPRTTIVEIIQEVAALRKLIVPDEFLRLLAKQARGLPGLAVSLTITAIDSSSKELVSGKILLDQLGVFMQHHVGRDASVLLAAFACGGARGIGVTQVAKSLGKDIAATKAAADRIALAGTLEQTGRDTLAVQPEFLRAALITREFFPPEGGGLGWALCEQLIVSSSEPASGYLELFRARASAGAHIDDDFLRNIAARLHDSRIWASLAWLNPHNCSWTLSRVGDLSAEIKCAALYHIPSEILPKMLSGASNETRALNTAPDADMRLIKDWIAGGAPTQAFERRQILFQATAKWMNSGGDVTTAFAALAEAFGLTFETTDTDPAKPNTMRIHSGMIGLDVVKQVFGLWPRLIALIQGQKEIPWAKVVQVVDNWSCAFSSFGKPLPADYVSFLSGCVKQMILDLSSLTRGNDAVGRWILLKAKHRDVKLAQSPVNEDFMVLFPEESLDDDYQKVEAAQAEEVRKMLLRWRDQPTDKIILRFAEWVKQAEEFLGLCSQMPWVFCSKLAEQRNLTNRELALVMDQLASHYAGPFVTKALETGTLDGELLERCLRDDKFTGALISPALTGKNPDLYDKLSERLPRFSNLVRVLCMRREIPEAMLERLLQHPDIHVRIEVAIGMFRSHRPPAIAESHRSLWHSAVVAGISAILCSESHDHLHDLSQLVAFEPSIAREILDSLLASERKYHGLVTDKFRSELVQHLSKDERRTMLSKCKGLIHSDLPRQLVGDDLDLFKELLATKELKQFHLDFLVGDPTNAAWAVRAKLALSAGYSHTDIAIATQGGSFSWEGGLSGYYQMWVDRFEVLKNSGDADLKRIAEEGLKRAVSQRDVHRRSEKKEEIDGWV